MTKEDLIIARLDRIEDKVDKNLEAVAALKIKAGVWGAIAGFIPGAIGILMWLASVWNTQ